MPSPVQMAYGKLYQGPDKGLTPAPRRPLEPTARATHGYTYQLSQSTNGSHQPDVHRFERFAAPFSLSTEVLRHHLRYVKGRRPKVNSTRCEMGMGFSPSCPHVYTCGDQAYAHQLGLTRQTVRPVMPCPSLLGFNLGHMISRLALGAAVQACI